MPEEPDKAELPSPSRSLLTPEEAALLRSHLKKPYRTELTQAEKDAINKTSPGFA